MFLGESDYEASLDAHLSDLRQRPLEEVREIYESLRPDGGILRGLFYLFSPRATAMADACEAILAREDRKSDLKSE